MIVEAPKEHICKFINLSLLIPILNTVKESFL